MASKAIGFLNFKFGADLSGFDRAMKKAQKNLKKFGKNIQKTGKSLTMGLTLPIVALGAASVKAFDEQQKSIAQVEAGLKSTAGAVGYTSEQLQKMAADLQKTTLFGDEEILKGATAQLLTFTNITGKEFAKTQEIALDLATRLDGDLKSASIMLGKALNDPVANLSALSRAGIQFSIEQKETIKSLVETNRLADAQTIILAELEKQYGGSAEAAAAAGMGPIKQLTNQLSDLSEQIGARIVPYIKTFVGWITGLAEKFDGLSESTKDNIVTFGLILAAIGPVLIIIGKMSIGISALIPLFAKLAMINPYILATAGAAALALGIYKLTTSFTEQYNAQEKLNDINNTARKSVQKDLTNIKVSTQLLLDENTTLSHKKKILDNLKKSYPGYYDQLDETTVSTLTLSQANDKLVNSLLKTAQIKALEGRLIKIQDKIIDAGETINTSFLEDWGLTGGTTPVDFMLKMFNTKTGIKNIGNLNKESKLLLETLQKLLIKTEDFNEVITKVSHESEDLKDETTDLTQATKEYDASLDPLLTNIKDYSENMIIAGSAMEGVESGTRKLTDAQQLGAAGFQMFGDILTSSLDSALDSQQNFFQEFVKNIKRAIRSLLVQLAVMTLIQAIMPFGMGGMGKSAFTLSNIKNNLMGLMNIPGLHEGGLVTGPTTALIGEGPGTSISNPEVVAPLDKLKSMIGGDGNQHITVTGKLIGNDIFLSNAKAGVDRLRTV